MIKNKSKSVSLRVILLIVLILLISISIGYKYFEWKIFNNISSIYNRAYFEEISLTSEGGRIFEKYTNLMSSQSFTDPRDTTEYLEILTNIDNTLNININFLEGYGTLLKENLYKFSELKKGSNFLIGERRNIAKKIINYHLDYYKNEMEMNQIQLSQNYGVKTLINIWSDNTKLVDFLNKIGSSVDSDYIGKYFSEIISLEKYSNNDFKFENEDIIRKYYPNSVSKLNSWKEYFAAYYSAEKNFVRGNTETAFLELQAVKDNASNATTDYNTIFTEQESQTSEKSRAILKIVSNQAATIKEYKSKGLYKYPLLKENNIWIEDFVLCQMYNYKTQIYQSITSKYPSSKTVSGLIKELSTINPKTSNVDSTFDKSVMKFTNTDKKIEFICENKYNNKKLVFNILK